MTYFLDPKPLPERRASGLTGGLPSNWDAFTARWQSGHLDGGYRNFEDVRTRREIQNERFDRIADTLGDEAILSGLADRGLVAPGMSGFNRDLYRNSPAVQDAIVEIAKAAAEQEPDAWGDVDLGDDFVEREAMSRLQAEYQDAQEIISMSPQSFARDLIADIGSGTMNMKTTPFLVMGLGQGSFLSVVAREAGINVAVEASLLPSQFQAAEDLNIPDPNPVRQLFDAAVFGAAFGAGAEALVRGLRYATLRRQSVPAGMDPLDAEMATQQVEDALQRPNAFQRVREALEQAQDAAPQPPAGRPPLILRDRIDEGGFVPGEPPADWNAPADPATALEPVPVRERERPAQAESLDDLQAEATTEAERLEREATGGLKYPLLNAMKRAGMRIGPDSPEGQELIAIFGGRQQAMRSVPGFFRRGGLDPEQQSGMTTGRALDNLEASAWDERFRGMADAAGVDNGYLNREGVLDLLRREAGGDWSWMQKMQEAAELRRASRASALDEWEAKTVPDDPRVMFVNRDAMLMNMPEWEVEREIGEMMDRWFEENGWARILTDAERAEIRYAMQKNGGEPELLVERALEREQSFTETPDEAAEAIPAGSAEAPRGGVAGETRPVSGEARGGAEGVGRDDASAFPVQRTDIGDQFLVPGTERVQTGVAQRQQAEMAARQQQSAMRRGDQQRVEDDPDSLFGGGTRDLFDDPVSPETRVVHDALADDTRRIIEDGGDFLVDMGDGKGERMASTVLDDLDQGDIFAARIELCGKGPA